ncbi:Wzz/FepE/Etk N-terminal domain-containing protein [Neptuniibacter sp. QD72_48]|uniref:Wzz/FepE/Etk N-terminal domain-containing protein n=1 Tax=unclassified Neptuniibacter TaxID=2630693 RepID=UPI0039F4C5A9
MQIKPYDQTDSRNEIDLIELGQDIWQGKWILIILIIASLLLGFAYTQMATKQYRITVSYTPILNSVSDQQNCNTDRKCLKEASSKWVMGEFTGGWIKHKKSNTVSLISTNPKSSSEYINIVKAIESRINTAILDEARNEQHLIQNKLNKEILRTERVATNYLHAARIIKAIERGSNAIQFNKPRISKVSPKASLIISLSACIAAIVGIFYILLRSSIRKRKSLKGH